MKEPEFFTVREFSEMTRYHEGTIVSMIKAGKIKAVSWSGKRSYRIPKTELSRIVEMQTVDRMTNREKE